MFKGSKIFRNETFEFSGACGKQSFESDWSETRERSSNLSPSQGFWRNHKGRVPIIFPHQHRRFLRPIRGRQYNKRGYFYFNKPIELRVI